MARTPKEVTDAELAVLQVLWDGGASPVRAIAQSIYPDAGNSESATVQKLCERLLAKGWVARDRRRRPHTFRALLDREDLIGRQLKSVADRLCEGEYVPLINHLVRGGKLSADDLRLLKTEVAKLDAERRSARGKRSP